MDLALHTDPSEMYADGWRAYIDGSRVEIIPTHHALRGIPIPAGVSTVELRYQPFALQVGLRVGSGTAVMMVGLLATTWWTRGREWWSATARRAEAPRAG